MSKISGSTVDLLKGIADMQDALADGKPLDFLGVFGMASTTPTDIKAAFNRDELNNKTPELVDAALGDAMTVGDEVAIAAAWERAVQSSYQQRVRRMAHARGRYAGQGSAQGLLRYGIQEILARPE